jgi:hypothetical protein
MKAELGMLNFPQSFVSALAGSATREGGRCLLRYEQRPECIFCAVASVRRSSASSLLGQGSDRGFQWVES